MACSMELPSTPEDLLARDKASWKELLKDNAKWQSIPMLNHTPIHMLMDQALVRFRGMVQDMQDPEIYLERYVIKSADGSIRLKEGKYSDCLHMGKDETLDYDAKLNKHGERRTLFVVSIPGQNDWAKEHEKQCSKQPEQYENHQAVVGNGIKRVLDEQEDMEVDRPDEASSLKRQCIAVERKDATAGSSGMLSSDYLLNSPLPNRPSMACMVKVYEDFDEYTLNALMDFVGFLSVDPALDASMLDAEAMKGVESLTELHAQNPSPFLIPRLHAFGVKPLPHANPLLDESLQQPAAVEMSSPETVHKDLRMLLKLCIFDDELAAEYLLCHLISSVCNRNGMLNIGKFALNICNLPKDCLQQYTTKLYEVLELLLPASHYLPMTLDTMNTASFAPKKDYETNKLVSGLLQLAPHTHLMLDETRMQQGQLQENGVRAIEYLAHLINYQQIKAEFQYYKIDYNVDIPVLVVSEGRSMLPSDFVLPINAGLKAIELFEESLKAALHYLQPRRLQQIRTYLTMARTVEFCVSEEYTEMIQQEFVEMRKANIKTNADDLHGLLVLSRLIGVARGKVALDKEIWLMATKLESKRRQRLQALPKSRVQQRN